MTLDRQAIDEQLKDLGGKVYEMYKNSKVLHHLPDILQPGETIRAVCAATISKRGWLLVVTGQRILMLTKGIFSKFKYEQLPLSVIDGVYHLPGLMFDKVQLNSRGKPIVIQVLVKDDAPLLTSALIDLLQAQAQAEEQGAPDCVGTGPKLNRTLPARGI